MAGTCRYCLLSFAVHRPEKVKTSPDKLQHATLIYSFTFDSFQSQLNVLDCLVFNMVFELTQATFKGSEPKAITALIPGLLSVLEHVPAGCNFFLAQRLTSQEHNQMLSGCKTIDFSAYKVINTI